MMAIAYIFEFTWVEKRYLYIYNFLIFNLFS